MKLYLISIVNKNDILDTIAVHANNENEASDLATEFIEWDEELSMYNEYMRHEPNNCLELYFRSNPRHQILFAGVK